MSISRRLTIGLVLTMAVGLGLFELIAYRRIRADAELDLLASAERIHGVLMATRRVYHRRFVESGLALDDRTVGFLPAFAMAQISAELAEADGSGFSFNNVSDQPRNPRQRADVVEQAAIAYFREHPDADVRFRREDTPDGRDYFHYARPIRLEQYCLECHGDRAHAPPSIAARYDGGFGYQVGELRGILSIKIPAGGVDEQVERAFIQTLGWGLGMTLALAALVAWVVRRSVTTPLGVLLGRLDEMRREGRAAELPLVPGELGAVAASFNALAAALAVQQAGLEASERSFRALLASTSDAIIVADRAGAIRYWNPAAARVFGYDAAEILGRPVETLIPVEQRALHRAGLARAGEVHGVTLGPTRQLQGLRKGGERFSAELSLSTWSEDGEARFVGILRDETERRVAELHGPEGAEKKLAVSRVMQRSELPLTERLGEALDIVLDLEGLAVERRGAIFVVEPGRDDLTLVVSRGGMVPCATQLGDRLPAGRCLCGRALLHRTVQLSADAHTDAEHDVRPDGMNAHGHYTVPLIAAAECVGVMTLYTSPHATFIPQRLEAIREVADLLALAVANDRAVRATREALDQAEAAARAKSTFLATVSHEIRTPMNAVLGFSRLGLELAAAAEARAYFVEIHRASTNLLGILNDVLDYAKIEAGKLEIEPAPVEPRTLVDEVCSLYYPMAAEKGFSLTVEVEHAVPRVVEGDPLRLRQILSNLVANAVKFTSRGEVHVSVSLDEGQMLVLRVSDTGIGMTPAQVATLFEPFVQADGSISRRFGGTGLGLSICHRLAGLMGAKISVQSCAGVGSTFSLALPLREPAMPAPRARPVEPPTVDLTGLSVLLAEDNPTNQLVARAMLRRLGVAVSVVGDGASVLQALEGGRFDVVLMDLQMPVMDGLEATRRIRADGRWSDLPVIALTASAMLDHQAACRAAGMTDFLAKPLLPEELKSVLHRATASRRSS